jgi:CheY-like chemotaxis protein
VREVTVRALQGAGYRTLVASDGSAGLELIEGRTAGIDLLLTDVVMPGMGGTTVAEELRRRMPGLRVLFVSGYAKAASLDHGAAGSPMQFLAKPFTSTALLERVRQLLDAAPARAGAA